MSCSFLKNNLRHIFWWKTILTELRILNCQVFYLRFTEIITLNCSSFVWKSLGLRERPILQSTDLWHNITISPFWEGNLSICEHQSAFTKENTAQKMKFSMKDLWPNVNVTKINVTKSGVSCGFGHIYWINS